MTAKAKTKETARNGRPSVAKASMAGPEDEKRAINAGYQVHLSKPIDAGELSTIASALIDRTND